MPFMLHLKIREQLFLGQDKMAKNDVHMFVGLRTHSRREGCVSSLVLEMHHTLWILENINLVF